MFLLTFSFLEIFQIIEFQVRIIPYQIKITRIKIKGMSVYYKKTKHFYMLKVKMIKMILYEFFELLIKGTQQLYKEKISIFAEL